MPNYKVVLFTDSIHQQYMTEQQEAMKKAFPTITIELVDHTDSRFALYGARQRIPCIMTFKDDARMRSRHAKFQHDEAIAWVRPQIT